MSTFEVHSIEISAPSRLRFDTSRIRPIFPSGRMRSRMSRMATP